ncbi:DUF7116 family protein [Halocatena salina]|uniref:Uncharacterized protein n=1 Tax=Halocatena salina TaxID=2934340 RepID=A0A8U0A0X1_9EURY|nr:hypothetical protein [Halocatena salina]UPM42770.1 hypothetical protein MW046_12525 [Halocatena salina]
MGIISTPLLEEARSIFSDLGYTVSTAGTELRAERKWRVVYVTTSDPDDTPNRGDLRCFVAPEDRAASLCEELLARAPDYEWAVMELADSGGYRIHHPRTSEGISA